MEMTIFTTGLILAAVSFAVTKSFTNLISKLEGNLQAKQTKTTNKTSIRLAISLVAFIMLLIPAESAAQTCPNSFSVQGNNTLRIIWNGAADVILNIDSIDFIHDDGAKTTNYGDIGSYQGSKAWQTGNNNYTNADETGTGRINVYSSSEGTISCLFNGNALPIELMYFKGQVIDGVTVLTWATASEQNNSHFTIERSTDNTNWEVVTVINGAGNSINTLKYEAKDYTPVNGTVYYRLRQDDYDGKYTYANTLAIKNDNNLKLDIMGMYVENNTLRVSFTGKADADNVEIQIVSLLGTVQTIKTVSPNEFNGNQVELDISELKGGIYNITVKSGDDITSGKFIK